jgi:hypothetical protein
VVAAVVAIAALWPRPPIPPDNVANEPLVEIRKELADGHADLLGAAGRPRHARWLIGSASVLEPTDATPAFAFEAPEPTLLELLSTPGVVAYRLTGEFQLRYTKAVVKGNGKRDETGLADAAECGFFCGDHALRTTDGQPVRVCVTAGYMDHYSPQARALVPGLQGAAQMTAAGVIPDPAGGVQSRVAGAGNVLRFPLADAVPTPWRRVRIDVTPAGVTMFWAAAPAADWQPVAFRTGVEITRDLNQKAARLGVPLAPHEPLAWHPAAPCGLWCRGAAIAVRNVSVDRIPSPP